ncbi:glycosyltransferase family 4 protein [Halobaculum halobium]|uniref:glycosyltransferase family 4 protein n=1 Tax=Halobaculum halobium TaxID=3032281 RepID=UPI00361DAA76
MADDLQAAVRDLDIEDNVVFTGAVDHGEVAHYYTAADVFCLPSHHESFGMVNIEAMACGTPVVSTRIDAIEEYLVDGKNGLLVPPGDVDGLAAALRRLADDASLRERLGRNARETASQFSWDAQTARLEEIYERLD